MTSFLEKNVPVVMIVPSHRHSVLDGRPHGVPVYPGTLREGEDVIQVRICLKN